MPKPQTTSSYSVYRECCSTLNQQRETSFLCQFDRNCFCLHISAHVAQQRMRIQGWFLDLQSLITYISTCWRTLYVWITLLNSFDEKTKEIPADLKKCGISQLRTRIPFSMRSRPPYVNVTELDWQLWYRWGAAFNLSAYEFTVASH